MDPPPPPDLAAPPTVLALRDLAPPVQGRPGSLASVRSGRDLVKAADETVFVPEQLYAFLTSPEHTVTACLGNATVDMPVRIIAEHLFGLGYGSFGLWTGEMPTRPPERVERDPLKGVKGWLGRITGKPGRRSGSPAKKENESERASDESDADTDTIRSMRNLSTSELDEVRRCGQWRGASPSDLFLNIYAQALLALEKNPLNGLVSPALMGACGVAPLTIISHSLDIVRHYASLIARSKSEIFFTTNVWEASEAASIVADALRALSKAVMERGGPKVVVKIMYDRGVADGGAHQRVDPKIFSSPAVGLPSPEEVPGCSLEVQNYHIPPVGSFHQKTVIVDRQVALLSSNNVQNRDDVGFMVQLEGPIVQSIYDTAILSWWMSFKDPLPLLARPPEYPDTLSEQDFIFGEAHKDVEGMGDREAIAERTRQRLVLTPPVEGNPFSPVVVHAPHAPFPVAMVNRTPRGRRGCGDAFVPQNQAWLAGFKFATRKVFLQTPTFSAKPLVLAALEAVRRGVVVEIYADLEFDNGTPSAEGRANQLVAAYMYSQLVPEHRQNLRVYWYTAKGDSIVDEQIAVQGNGNADVNSWLHAQEINVLVDSAQLCREWRTALDANQDTRAQGRVGDDGVWRDASGRALPAAPESTPATMPRTLVRETPVRDVRNREPRPPMPKRDSGGIALVKKAAAAAAAKSPRPQSMDGKKV
ncbi:uncharacterized protein CcaverHIS019_0402950 [Cutaneotrichosporon cavernicola]|uniref:PLD phosphodiesterase domain-containing protein n=1 Tax=Cutaneotrichosporon cavernicola TaxID=279322 RepID=A0AA48L3W1_9TREE|nr:uncharacterized protein CcaverHIS019_0402950 [Cutaneotrichosporon cavernicola]BEI91475.1 hypothetical protein CcaverHIS019_0402950 [Cutaneotrichosporon cavernicola]BEI99250.1 hypothetical protein CcaverHIS631_0402930 [Cutaneotrichosporon cavernicola]BEJ07027.1 hypothetical protein CcaverHIS641_0402960 [Cutaneotrichosporon cavernicola]